MDLVAAGLDQQPFRTDGSSLSTVSYRAYRDARAMLKKTRSIYNGLLLLQGPTLSGKSTVLREFVADIPEDCAVALIDGAGLTTAGLLEHMLSQFGYPPDFDSTGEMLAMTRVFALQQASSHEPPMVIVENAHDLDPGAWQTLNELAELQVRQTSAIKLVLVSDRSIRDRMKSPLTETLAKRLTADFHLRPLTSDEARDFLYTKLRAAGSDAPDFVFPVSVCNELWQASGGWPGILERLALLALARAETLPVNTSVIEWPILPAGTWDEQPADNEDVSDGDLPVLPTLHVTHNGETVKTLVFDKARLLIGRAEHNDLSINSRFVSRHHVVLVRSGGDTLLLDLNSTNGSFVNSRRVSNHVLVDDDIIAVGQHRIKFRDPSAKQRKDLDGDGLADTSIMKTIEDMRRAQPEENAAVPSA